MLEYGCPFEDDPGNGLIRFLRGNMGRGKGNWLSSEGSTGSGKSTTSGQIAKRLEPGFDIQHDPIFTLEEFLRVLERFEKRKVYVLDEGISIFHNQDWATWQLKWLTKIVRKMRLMESTWIVNAQDYEGLHPYLREYEVRIRLYHRPVFDADGMGNGPPQVFWKNERFDYKEQRVTTRWQELEADLHIDPLDDDPNYAGYVERKEQDFKDHVKAFRDRLQAEERTRERKSKKRRPSKGRQSSPPTTT